MNSNVRLVSLIILLVGFYPAMPANADEIRPVLLDIKEQSTGLFAFTWKVPTRGDRVLAITPHLPDGYPYLGHSRQGGLDGFFDSAVSADMS